MKRFAGVCVHFMINTVCVRLSGGYKSKPLHNTQSFLYKSISRPHLYGVCVCVCLSVHDREKEYN